MKKAIKQLEKRIEALNGVIMESDKITAEGCTYAEYEFARSDIHNSINEILELQDAIDILNRELGKKQTKDGKN